MWLWRHQVSITFVRNRQIVHIVHTNTYVYTYIRIIGIYIYIYTAIYYTYIYIYIYIYVWPYIVSSLLSAEAGCYISIVVCSLLVFTCSRNYTGKMTALAMWSFHGFSDKYHENVILKSWNMHRNIFHASDPAIRPYMTENIVFCRFWGVRDFAVFYSLYIYIL